jgi:hypothetical protein
VLDLDDQHPGIARRRPVLVELVGPLLLRAVVAGPVETVAVVGLEVRVGWLLAEAVDRLREVAVVDDEGIARFRVRVESFRHQDVRAQVHRASPELRQPLALDPLVTDVLRGRRLRDGRDRLVERDLDGRGRRGIDRDLARRAVEVARSLVPLLPFAAVHGQLHGVPVAAVERLVPVQERLDRVRTRGQVA